MKLAVREWGVGPQVAVLLHGVISSAGSWARVGPRLGEMGYRCLAPDLRGHGDSPKPDRGYEPDDLLADLADSLPREPDLLIGHSMGALLGLGVAARGHLCPRLLVLEDPLLVSTRETSAELYAALMQEIDHGASEEAVRLVNPGWNSIDVREKAMGLEKVSSTAVRQILDRDLDALPLFACLNMPTLVIRAGARQYVTDELAELIEAALGRGSVVTVEGAGHSIHRDDLDGFMAALRPFLTAESPASQR